MPCTPNACSAALTSSSLKGLMTAVMSLMGPPSRSLPPTVPYARFSRPVGMCQNSEAAGPTVTSGFPGSGAEYRVHERRRVERREVVWALAEADELHRDADLALHGDHDAALGGA